MGAMQNRCANMLIALALWRSIGPFVFWDEAVQIFIVDVFSHFSNRLPDCAIASPSGPRAFRTARYCVAVPGEFVQYRADCAQPLLIHLLRPESTAQLFTRLAPQRPDRSFGGDWQGRLADGCSQRMLALPEGGAEKLRPTLMSRISVALRRQRSHVRIVSVELKPQLEARWAAIESGNR